MTARPRSRRVGLALAATLAALVAAEIAVRVAFHDEVDTATLEAELDTFSIGSLKRFSDDPVLYFELEPGLREPFGDGLVVTDEQGVRVADPPRAPRPDAVRLAVVGDSTSFGWKVDYDASYPDVARAGLERRWGVPVDLRNFSVPAYQAVEERRLLETRVLDWQPDLLVWHYDHNDVIPARDAGWAVGMPPTYGDNPLGSALVKLVMRRRRRAATRAPEVDRDAHVIHRGHIAAGPLHDAHLEELAAVAERCRRERLPVFLVVYDTDVQPGENGDAHLRALHDPLVPVLRDLGFEVLDTFGAFRGVVETRGWDDLQPWWLSRRPVDPHPTEDAHAFVGALVAETVLTRWPEPPPRRRP